MDGMGGNYGWDGRELIKHLSEAFATPGKNGEAPMAVAVAILVACERWTDTDDEKYWAPFKNIIFEWAKDISVFAPNFVADPQALEAIHQKGPLAVFEVYKHQFLNRRRLTRSRTPETGPVAASAEEEDEVKKLPMMPIRDMLIFPYMKTPFVAGEFSVRALEEALAADKKIFLATQHEASVDKPTPDEIYQVGTVVNISQSLKFPDGNIEVLVEGIERGKILQVTDTEGFMQVTVSLPGYASESAPEIETAKQRVISLFEQYVKLCQALNYETMISAVRMEDPAKLTDVISANLQLSIEEKQELLEIFDPAERLNRIGVLLDLEIKKRAPASAGEPQT